MRTKLAVVVAGVGLMLAAGPLWAHHAFSAEFDVAKPHDAEGNTREMGNGQSPLLVPHRRAKTGRHGRQLDDRGRQSEPAHPAGRDEEHAGDWNGARSSKAIWRRTGPTRPSAGTLRSRMGGGCSSAGPPRAQIPTSRPRDRTRRECRLFYCFGAPGAAPGSPADEPTNSFFPSVNVMMLPLARLAPSFAWKPSTQYFGAGQQRLFRPAAAEQRVGSRGFDHPARHLAVVAFDVDVDPGVRIDPFHLRDRSLELDRLVRIKFRGECVVGPHGRGRQQQATAGNHD